MALTDSMPWPSIFPVTGHDSPRLARRQRRLFNQRSFEPEPLTPSVAAPVTVRNTKMAAFHGGRAWPDSSDAVVEEESTWPETPGALSQRDRTVVDRVPPFIVEREASTRGDPTIPYCARVEANDRRPDSPPRAAGRRGVTGDATSLPPLMSKGPGRAPRAGAAPEPSGSRMQVSRPAPRVPAPAAEHRAPSVAADVPLPSRQRALTTEQINFDEDSLCTRRSRGWLGPLLLLVLLAACGLGYCLLQADWW